MLKKSIVILFLLFLVMGFDFGESAHAASLLKQGDRGDHVYQLQRQLKKMGYFHTQPTGYYGPVTRESVRRFQSDMHIMQNGMVGKNTYNHLRNVEKLAHAVYGEARGESYIGQVAVAAVVLNRVDSSQFPNTIDGVLFQTNAFTAVHDGQYHLSPNHTAYRAAIDAMRGWDPSSGSYYYYNPSIATSKWILTRHVVKRIGGHVFAR